MNKFIKKAIFDLMHANNPGDLLPIFTYLNGNGQDLCIQIALEEYNRSVLSSELISLVNEPNSDLLSYFYKNTIYFLDKKIIKNMIKNYNYDFEVDYSVMLDTNYASYISTFVRNPEKVSNRIIKYLDILICNDFRFDYIIYILENFYNVFHKEGIDTNILKENRASFYYNLMNLEFFKNINTQKYIEQKKIEFAITKEEAFMHTDIIYNDLLNSKKSKKMLKPYLNIHKMMMLYIIGILKVRFSSNKAPHNKINDMFSFMNEIAGLYFDREIKVTYDFFENPNKFKMFDNIYKGIDKTRLTKNISNIAWDFSISRIVERAIIDESETRYFIPLILTHDINMKTIFHSYEVKGVIFNESKTFLTTYSKNNTYDYLKDKKCKINYSNFFSDKAKKKRIEIYENNKSNDFKIIDKELNELVEILNN